MPKKEDIKYKQNFTEMNCIDVATNMQLFLDEELPPRDMNEVRDHLAKCPLCDEKFESEKLFKQVLKEKICKKCATDALMHEVRELVFNANATV
jgi:anti-sigma factor (TIGR02949 family)